MTARMHASRFLRDDHGFIISQRVEIGPDAPPAQNIEFIDGSGLTYPDPRPLRTTATTTATDVARTERVDPAEINFAAPDRGPAPAPEILERIRGAFGRVLRRGGR